MTGSEPDLGRLVAAVFGLKPVLQNSAWENLFAGIDSGRINVGFSNFTVTEERTYSGADIGDQSGRTAAYRQLSWRGRRPQLRGHLCDIMNS